jgi:energy-coupling factor transport system substrate-specific component
MIACQLSLCPLGTGDFTALISDAVDSLKPLQDRGLRLDVGSMSTVVTGPDDLVWQAARLVFDTATRDGHRIVLTSTFSNECGCDLPPSAT